MSNSKISVIMSAYNSSEHLEKSITSILEQTFDDFEFIIIDDASTDNSLEIIESLKRGDSRIVVIHNETNIGLTKSLNKGLKIANGKYIARQDSHNISYPGRFKMQYTFLENNESVFLVGSSMITVMPNGNTFYWRVVGNKQLKKTFEKKTAIPHPSIMFRNTKDTFYREKFVYSQDCDFFLNLLSSDKKLACLPDFYIKYWLVPATISYKNRAKQWFFAEKAREFYFQRIKYGKDEYDKFDPDDILKIDMNKTVDKKLLGWAIEAHFKINNYQQVKKLYKRYMASGVKIDKYAVYFLISFFPATLVDGLRKIMWRTF